MPWKLPTQPLKRLCYALTFWMCHGPRGREPADVVTASWVMPRSRATRRSVELPSVHSTGSSASVPGSAAARSSERLDFRT